MERLQGEITRAGVSPIACCRNVFALSTKVFIIDGCSIHVAHVWCKQGLFPKKKKIGFDDSFDVTKCLQQIEMPDLFHKCALVN